MIFPTLNMIICQGTQVVGILDPRLVEAESLGVVETLGLYVLSVSIRQHE